MNGYLRYRRVCRLRGWVKWLPFLLLPFFVLFFEVWLHTHMRECDYEVSQLNASVRSLRSEIDQLKSSEAALETMDMIQASADRLGLVAPQPDQIVVVYVDEEPELTLQSASFELASLDLDMMDSADVASSQGVSNAVGEEPLH